VYEKSMPGELDFTQKLEAAKKAGFDYLELSIDETDEKLARLQWGPEEIKSLRHAIEKIGVPILSLCLSGHRRFPLGDPDPDAQQKSLAIMRETLDLALALGVRIIQIAGYDVYYKPSDARTAEIFAVNLGHAVAMASRAGVVLAFETMETPFMNTVEKAAQWVRRIASPWLQIYPDIGNITNAALAGGNGEAGVIADLETGKGHIAAVHLKETTPGIFREVPYGKGHVNFGAAAAAARHLGVGLFVGEFWHKGEENWREILRENNRFLRSFLDNTYSQ
jgi:predicted hexulose-6-phosphate isomerase